MYSLIFIIFVLFLSVPEFYQVLSTAGWPIARSGYWGWQCKTTVRRNTGEDCCFCSQETDGHAKFQNNQILGTKCSLNTGRVGDTAWICNLEVPGLIPPTYH